MMKKVFAFILISGLFTALWASDNYVGKGLEGNRYAVFEPALINISSSEASWLGESVKSYLNTQIKLYTGMTSVNVANTDVIKQYQKKSVSGEMDEESSIEIGKMLSAQFAIISKITKTDETYMLSCVVTDLTTGVNSASYDIRNVPKASDLYGSAMNKLILNLVPQMGVNLTAMGKYSLNNDGTDISTEQQAVLNKQELESYSKQLAQMEADLAKYKTSDALKNQDMQNERAKLETEQNLLKQKQQQAEKKQMELAERAEREAKEKAAAAERSEQANAMLKSLSGSVEEAAANVRKAQFSNMSPEERIILIETKKRTYIDINNQIETQKNILKIQAENEYKAVAKDVNDPKNYDKFDLYEENGKLLPAPEAVKELEAKNQKEKERITASLNADINNITKSTNEQIASIKKEINSDLNNLGKKETASSLSDEGLFKVLSWNGKDRVWNAQFNIYLGNIPFITQNFTLSFTELKNEFSDTLGGLSNGQAFEVLDSMFTMGTPIIYAEADYKIEPMEEKYPSCYTVTPLEFRLINSQTGKVIKTIIPDSDITQAGLQYEPINDMRTPVQKKTDAKETVAKEKSKAKKSEKNAIYSQSMDGGARTTLGFNFGYTDGISSGFVCDFNGTLGLTPWLYTGLVFGTNDTEDVSGYGTLGINVRLPLGNWYPNFYGEIGLGCRVYKDKNESNLENYSFKTDSIPVDFSLRYALGVDLPFCRFLSLNLQYALVELKSSDDETGYYDRFTLGIMLGSTGSVWSWLFN